MGDAYFDSDLKFGAVGEGIITRILDSRGIQYDDLTGDPTYRKIDVDYRMYRERPMLIDVKTHNSWDRFSIETMSSVERGVRGCDFTSKAEFFVHVFPIIETVIVVKQKRLLQFIKDNPKWKDIPEQDYTSHGPDGSTWTGRYKWWNFTNMPEEGKDIWWQTFDFELTKDEILSLFKFDKFAKGAIQYETLERKLPVFTEGQEIRCPFCLQKNRSGNMLVKVQKNGSSFFACNTCFIEHKKDPAVRSSFNCDGCDKNGKCVTPYPLRFLQRLV